MEFRDVVARRRMVRRYTSQPVDPAFLERALTHATRAPSAGFTQGWSFLLLRTPDDVGNFWVATSPAVEESRSDVTKPSPGSRPNPWLDGMQTAPVIIVVMASEAAYRDRYSEADKAGASARAANMPWWQIDAAMAALLILQTATDEGVGACFFGVPAAGVPQLRATFGIPEEVSPIGAITVGHPATADHSGSPSRRGRRSLEDVVHDGQWGSRLVV